MQKNIFGDSCFAMESKSTVGVQTWIIKRMDRKLDEHENLVEIDELPVNVEMKKPRSIFDIPLKNLSKLNMHAYAIVHITNFNCFQSERSVTLPNQRTRETT